MATTEKGSFPDRGARREHAPNKVQQLREKAKIKPIAPIEYREEKGLPIPDGNGDNHDLEVKVKNNVSGSEKQSLNEEEAGLQQAPLSKAPSKSEGDGVCQREEKEERKTKTSTNVIGNVATPQKQQVPISKYSLNVGASEFVPMTKKDSKTDKEEFSLHAFDDALRTLSKQPYKFDDVSGDQVAKISKTLKLPETMKKVVNNLLEMTVSDSNFLYSAVRLISVFLERLVSGTCVTSFREFFFPRLKELHEEFPALLNARENAQSQSKAFGIALLFADLLCRVEVKENELSPQFLQPVFQIIDMLKENPTEKMVTTLIKVLKLTGPTLDDYKTRGDGIPQVNQVFNSFKELEEINKWLAHLENGTKLSDIIFNVYKLHTRNWDREPEADKATTVQSSKEKKEQPTAARASNTSLNAAASEFVPHVPSPIALSNDTNQDEFLLEQLQDVLVMLTYRPDKFERVVENLLEAISMFLTESKTVVQIVDTLFERAINIPSFMYTAVRMMSVFLDKLETDKEETSFKKFFYKKAKDIYEEFFTLLNDKNPKRLERASAIALLFAGLLCQVKIYGELNAMFKYAVFKMIDDLKESPTEGKVIILLRLLQQVGPTLDYFNAKDQSVPEVESLFQGFQDPSKNREWLANVENGKELSNAIFELYKLRTRNWDFEAFQSDADVDWSTFCGPEDVDEEDDYEDSYLKFLEESGQMKSSGS